MKKFYPTPTTVVDAAKVMDKEFPGWANNIDIDRLNMACPTSCVIGQQPSVEPGYYCDALTRMFGTAYLPLPCVFSNESLKPSWIQEINARKNAPIKIKIGQLTFELERKNAEKLKKQLDKLLA